MKYKTRQSQDIADFMKSAKGRQLSAADIGAYFKNRGQSIGMATVYRHLDQLVDDGVVAKIVADGSRSAYYEYIGHEDCVAPVCFHCKCLSCGKLIHLDCHDLVDVSEHLQEHHGFQMDPVKTIIYGMCAECQGKGASA